MKVQWLHTLKNSFLLVVGFFVITQAAVAACNVPVCDIPATISSLEKMTVDGRSIFLGDLYQKTKISNDVAIQQNIHDFSKESLALQIKLQDPENVISWSLFMRENSISRLFKFAPFNLNFMKDLYSETFEVPSLSIERQTRVRFDTYQRWKLDIKTIMDVRVILDLYSLVTFSQNLSEVNQDEDYVGREAVIVLDLLGKRLSYIYPAYEGVYEISTYCLPDPTQCGTADLSANRLTLLNSITDLGIFASMNDNDKDVQNYMFYRSVIENFGKRIYSMTEVIATLGRPSEMYVDIDSKQNIKGYVVSPRYSGTLHFVGVPAYSPIKFYLDEGLEAAKPNIVGKFEGSFGDKKATLIIRQKKNKALFASAVVAGNSGLNFDFTNGEYIDYRGIMNLVGFPLGKVEPFKLNLAYRKDENGNYRWTGMFYSIKGKLTKVEFSRTSDIDLPDDEATPVINLKLK